MNEQSPIENEVCIIGSGIGGFSTGLLLMKFGYRVTIIEKNRQPGGLMRSYTRGGIECPIGVHYLGSLGDGQILKKFFDYFGVTADIPCERMGKNGVIDRYLLDRGLVDSGTFDVPEGFDGYEQNLKRAFPRESAQVNEIMKGLRGASRQLHALDFLYAPENTMAILDQPESYGRFLGDLGCSPGLRAVLGIPSCWIGVPIDDCPPFYLNTTLASYLSSSWRLQGSGTAMAEVFADRFTSSGGKIMAGDAVEKILVESRSVKGVLLQSGEVIPASIVVGAIHPKTLLGMLPEDAVKPSYAKRITKLVDTYGVFCAHVAIDSSSHAEVPHNIFKVDTSGSGEILNVKFYQIRESGVPGKSLLSILSGGRPELWAQWEHTTTGKRGAAYRDAKENYADDLIREAAALFGDFNGLKILDLYTPLTIRDWVNSPGGSAYGVQRSYQQLLSGSVLSRTSIKNVYLAGQSVMAPGIIGTIMGSFNTVRQIVGHERFTREIAV